jgi:ankyrin repeat protein
MKSIFEAVMKDEDAVSQLLRESPELACSRAEEEYLLKSIPHSIYLGDTPLHVASAALRTWAARILLRNGADVNAKNRRGATSLHYSCDPRPNSGGVWNPKEQAALINLLIRRGARIEAADKSGATALHRAVRARSASAVRSLLENGASVHVPSGELGSSPLHLAVQSTGASGTADAAEQQLEIIRLLLAHGASAKAEDKRGRTVFDWARNKRVMSVLQSVI